MIHIGGEFLKRVHYFYGIIISYSFPQTLCNKYALIMLSCLAYALPATPFPNG
jgi:hypothetical protein